MRCSQHELDILRNTVFARYNYKFNSEFYQAYFNYYGFYRSEEKRRNRVKNVDHLLTASDKNNLRLIAQASKKGKK
jgi:hypothetical protein